MKSELSDFRSKMLFYTAYVCYFASTIIDFTQFTVIIPTTLLKAFTMSLTLAAMILLAVRFAFFERYNRAQLLLSVFIIAAISCAMLVNGSRTLLISSLFLVCSKDIDFDEFLGFAFKVIVITVVFLAALSVSGFIGMGTRTRVNGVLRYALGFNHPNHLGMLVFQLEAIYLYIRREKKTIVKYFLPTVMLVVCYLATNSMTPAVTGFLVIFGFFVYEKAWKYLWIEKEHSRSLLIFAIVFSLLLIAVVAVYFWNHPYSMPKVLKTLRTRLLLAKKYINAYGIHLFGSDILVGANVELPGYTAGYSFLDCGYARLLVEHGLIVFGIAAAVIVVFIRKLIKSRNTYLLIITAALLLFYVTEQKVAFMTFNVFVLALADVVFDIRKKDCEKLKKNESCKSFDKKNKKIRFA